MVTAVEDTWPGTLVLAAVRQNHGNLVRLADREVLHQRGLRKLPLKDERASRREGVVWPEHLHLPLHASAVMLRGWLAFSLAEAPLYYHDSVVSLIFGWVSTAVGDASTLHAALLPSQPHNSSVGLGLGFQPSPPRPHPVPVSFIAAVLTLRALLVQFSEHLQGINHLSLLLGITRAFDLFDFCTSGTVEALSNSTKVHKGAIIIPAAWPCRLALLETRCCSHKYTWREHWLPAYCIPDTLPSS